MDGSAPRRDNPPLPSIPVPPDGGASGVLGRLDAVLSPLKPGTVERGAILLALLLGAIDMALGPALSISFFYLLPIAIGAWYGGVEAGYFVAFLTLAIWTGAGFLSGVDLTSMRVLAWEMGLRLATFLAFASLTIRLRNALDTHREMAHSDSLTGLANSRAFFEHLSTEIDRAGRYGRIFTLAYFDLDHFKEVNDSMGHAEGDKVLTTIARTMRDSMRTTDIPARLGGDEFGVLLPETPFAQAEWALDKLRSEILRAMQAHGWPVTVSMGAVTFESPARSPDDAIRMADRLMYKVKAEGRDGMLHILWTGDDRDQPDGPT